MANRSGFSLGGMVQALGARSWALVTPYLQAYNSTDPNRKTLPGWFPRNATADQTLVWNLSRLIPQSRQIERTTGTGRGASNGFAADIVGTEIGIEADTGDLRLDAIIDAGMEAWAESATPVGDTFADVQRMLSLEWFTAGAALAQEIILPERVAEGLLPIVFQPLEIEWLTMYPVRPIASGNFFARGVEMDALGRPLFYHLMDYNALNAMGLGNAFGGPGYVIPAKDIIHAFERRRPRQTHGEPNLAPAIEPIMIDGKLVTTELLAAVQTAAPSYKITSEIGPGTDQVYNGEYTVDFKTGAVIRLLPGEDAAALVNPRPSEKLMPFRQGLRGDIASAIGSSQAYLDRDPSRANYSSSRMDELISGRMRRPLQNMFGRKVVLNMRNRVIPWILLQNGIPLPKDPVKLRALSKCKLLPDRPQYVDPEKDGKAAAFLIQNGLSTLQEECAATGKDAKKVQAKRAQEQRDADVLSVQRAIAVKKLIAANPELEGVAYTDIIAMSAGTPPPAAPAPPAAPEDTEKQPEEADTDKKQPAEKASKK